MANQILVTRSVSEVPSNPNLVRMAELAEKFRGHSVFTRIEAALKEGKDSLDFYRPNLSAKSDQMTAGLLDLMRLMGMTVERHPCSPSVALFVITNLRSWNSPE